LLVILILVFILLCVTSVIDAPPRWLNLLPTGLIFIFLLIFAIVPPFLFMYYVLLLFKS